MKNLLLSGIIATVFAGQVFAHGWGHNHHRGHYYRVDCWSHGRGHWGHCGRYWGNSPYDTKNCDKDFFTDNAIDSGEDQVINLGELTLHKLSKANNQGTVACMPIGAATKCSLEMNENGINIKKQVKRGGLNRSETLMTVQTLDDAITAMLDEARVGNCLVDLTQVDTKEKGVYKNLEVKDPAKDFLAQFKTAPKNTPPKVCSKYYIESNSVREMTIEPGESVILGRGGDDKAVKIRCAIQKPACAVVSDDSANYVYIQGEKRAPRVSNDRNGVRVARFTGDNVAVAAFSTRSEANKALKKLQAAQICQ